MKNARSILLLILALIACDAPKDKKAKKQEPVKDGINRTFRKDGSPLAEINMKGGKKHGIAKNFFPNGKLSLEMNYVEGKREGKSTRYYQDGKVYQESFYKNDKLNGERKRYREDGKLMSVSRWEDDLPCSGLVEYHLDGSKKTDYPSIRFVPVDHLSDGYYLLQMSMSNNVRAVNFYAGRLTPSGCFDLKKLDGIRTSQNGVGELRFDLYPGQFMMEEIHVVAKVKTVLGNEYYTTGTYNLSIRN